MNRDLYGQLARAAHDDLTAGLRRAGDALNQLADLAARLEDPELTSFTIIAGEVLNPISIRAEQLREHVRAIGREVPQ